MKTRVAALLVLCLMLLSAAPLSASWDGRFVWGRSLGYAVYTPNVETTFHSTPDEGVTLPTGTVTITVTVENNPIRYFHGSTAVTGTRGLLLPVGTWTLSFDAQLIGTMRFIDSSAGPSKVTVEYYTGR